MVVYFLISIWAAAAISLRDPFDNKLKGSNTVIEKIHNNNLWRITLIENIDEINVWSSFYKCRRLWIHIWDFIIQCWAGHNTCGALLVLNVQHWRYNFTSFYNFLVEYLWKCEWTSPEESSARIFMIVERSSNAKLSIPGKV